MAAYYYGINSGDGEYTVSVGSSTTSKDVEIVINPTTDVASVTQLLLAIENLQKYILRNGKPW